MVVLAFVALVGLAHGAVHESMAEAHYICNVCTQIVEDLKQGKIEDAYDLCRNDQKEEFTNLCSEILAKKMQIAELSLNTDCPYMICEQMAYCDFNYEGDYSGRALNEQMIREINNDPNSTWTAGHNTYFLDATLEDVRKVLGAVVDPKYTYKLPEKQYSRVRALPSEFDARQHWSDCTDIIGHVRDQSACGCCWAFGSTEAYNDRLCITNSSFQTSGQLLSVDHTCACCGFVQCGSEGCNGGQPSAAWQWFVNTGVVSGGDYDDKGKTDTCMPYELPPCAHHEPSSEYTPCPSSEYSTPSCKSKCTNSGYPLSFSGDKHHATKAYNVRRNVDDIMTDIYTYGTVTAAFSVYNDFVTYKSGVYQHKTGSYLGGHAIKIIGWGTEDGKDYWLCVNSWNDSWGLNGLFKILRGVDECGIEGSVSAGYA